MAFALYAIVGGLVLGTGFAMRNYTARRKY
jgi:hypothetical protein